MPPPMDSLSFSRRAGRATLQSLKPLFAPFLHRFQRRVQSAAEQAIVNVGMPQFELVKSISGSIESLFSRAYILQIGIDSIRNDVDALSSRVDALLARTDILQIGIDSIRNDV